jgi:hypothetical protein
MKRRWRLWLVVVAILSTLLVTAVWFDLTRMVIGLLSNENFYKGRPTSYWSRYLEKRVKDHYADARWASNVNRITKDFYLSGQALPGHELTKNSESIPVRFEVLMEELPKPVTDPAAIPVLTQLLQDGSPEVRWAAVFALGKVRSQTQRILPAVVAMLKDDNIYVRRGAADALGEMGAAAKECVPILMECMDDPELRSSAAWALARMGSDAEQAIPVLIDALSDEDDDARTSAAWALGRMGNKAVPMLVKRLQDRSPRTRALAARTLQYIGPSAKAAVPTLKDLLNDADAGVRQSASGALKEIEQGPPSP